MGCVLFTFRAVLAADSELDGLGLSIPAWERTAWVEAVCLFWSRVPQSQGLWELEEAACLREV